MLHRTPWTSVTAALSLVMSGSAKAQSGTFAVLAGNGPRKVGQTHLTETDAELPEALRKIRQGQNKTDDFLKKRKAAQTARTTSPFNSAGAGKIPTNQWVLIERHVCPDYLTIKVDGEQRYLERGDFSQISKPLRRNSRSSFNALRQANPSLPAAHLHPRRCSGAASETQRHASQPEAAAKSGANG
jgi:hypothetical protein